MEVNITTEINGIISFNEWVEVCCETCSDKDSYAYCDKWFTIGDLDKIHNFDNTLNCPYCGKNDYLNEIKEDDNIDRYKAQIKEVKNDS